MGTIYVFVWGLVLGGALGALVTAAVLAPRLQPKIAPPKKQGGHARGRKQPRTCGCCQREIGGAVRITRERDESYSLREVDQMGRSGYKHRANYPTYNRAETGAATMGLIVDYTD